jgi:acyl carrier protein
VAVTLAKIRRLVAEELRLKNVAADDLILEDLGAESIEVMSIITAIEERYGVIIAEGELPDLRTAAALFERVRAGESAPEG